MQLTFHVDGQIHARLQSLTENNLLHIIGLAKGDELYVTDKVILKAFYIVSITVFWLIAPLFWL